MSLKVRFSVSAGACTFAAALIFSFLSSPARRKLIVGPAGPAAGHGTQRQPTGAADQDGTSTTGTNSIADFTSSAAVTIASGGVWTNGITFDSAATLSGGQINLGGATPTIVANAPAVINDVLAGSAGMIMTGPSVLTLNATNTYTGGTTINGGTLQLNAAANGSGVATLAGGSNVIVNAGGTLVLNAANALGFNGGAANLTVNSGGLVSATGGLNVSLWNAVSMTGGTLASAGAGDPTYGNYDINGQLNATSDASGNPAVINATRIELQNSLGTVFNVTRGPGASDLDVSSAITNIGAFAYALTQSGNGIMLLTGNNTYTASTAITGGTLQIGGAGVLGGGNYPGAISIASSAALIVNSSSNQTFSGAISGGGGLTQAGTAR